MQETTRRGRPATNSIEPKIDTESIVTPTPVAQNDNAEILRMMQELKAENAQMKKEIARAK
jgi:DNA-directed RNA polymerase subunit L